MSTPTGGTGKELAITGNRGQFQKGDPRINTKGRPATAVVANRDTGNLLDDLPKRAAVSVMSLAPERNAPVYSLGDPMMQFTPMYVRLMLTHSLYGMWTRLQWVNMHAEILDGDVLALIERCLAPITVMTATIKVRDLGDEKDKSIAPDIAAKIKANKTLAAEQRQALQEYYSSFDGVMPAVKHLAMAKFRAYAHVKMIPDGEKIHLEPMPQLNFIRNGTRGKWLWNPKAIMTNPRDSGNLQDIEDSEYLIREKERSLSWLIAMKFVRSNFIDKAWDQFCDVISKLGKIITAPEDFDMNSAEGQLMMRIASMMAQGAGGVLPHGCNFEDTVNPNQGAGATFKDRATWLREGLIMAGTSGQLSMLSQPTGIGSGASDQHDKTFDLLAGKEAVEISEVFNRKIDDPFLNENFPGEPHLAYWALNHESETNASDVLEDATKAKTAGFQMDAEQASEKTGYRLTLTPQPLPAGGPQTGEGGPEGGKTGATPPAGEEGQIQNRARDLKNRSVQQAADGLGVPANWLSPVRDVIATLREKALDKSLTNAEFNEYAAKLVKRAPEIFKRMDHDALAGVLFSGMEKGVIDGVRGVLKKGTHGGSKP